MAVSESIYSVALKPKLLRSLLREYVPDERHPFSNPSELTYVVSTVKTHKLLSDWTPQPVEQDLAEAWKSAVDSWVHRLLTLASSNLPDKCWAGICLLGLTSQECSSERFITSYAVWLDKLLSCVQPPEVSNFVKAATCASLSDMFTRLGGFSNAKKDGTSQASRAIQTTLKLLNEDSPAFVLEEAICLLCTMINLFPLSVHRHHDNFEAAIVLKIMSGKCCTSVLKKLAYGLSLLPKSKGDEDSWSLMMDKILLHINSQLNDAFQGLEEEARSTQTMKALCPAGKEPPLPLGGLAMSERISDLSSRRPERLLGSGVSTLMQCCCDMLTSSYPIMVSVPVFGLIALAGRVLMVDGSLSSSSYSFMTTLKQEFICSEIPLLQLHSLEILAAVVKVLGSQLLPHAAGIVQVMKEYLWTCKFPDLKIKAYIILKVLLLSMGIGTAIHISQDIVNNVCIDLDILGGEKDGKSAGIQTNVHQGLSNNSHQRKRKHSFMVRSSQEKSVHDHSEVGNPHNSTPISVKIAALEALEALLTMGGSMRSEIWRGNVDHLLITVARNAFKEGWSREENNFFVHGDPMPMWADFQLAALRALLASLLSPGRTRPSHLALGLELFHRGMQETGTKLGEYCGHALLALEVLIHPRALPLLQSSADDYKFISYKSHDARYQAGTVGEGPGEPESENDDLNENWLRNDGDEMETQITHTQKPPASGTNDKSTADTYENMSESLGFRNNINQRTTVDDGDIGARSGGGALESVELEPVSGRVALVENDVTVKSGVISEVCKGSVSVSGTENDERAAIVERISAIFESVDEMSDDSLPDIVDGDPDSD
ncbi:hypothetical protein CASFOL_006084 [Castilleja foliolosa]|uniref:Pre-rRNA-processing protein RIX1 N-terminal domain-containing protein n=1 Tax=Castilleja foliolosa TaxID=1961234 RepID=A0ABD3E6B9_9LAMI